MNALGRVPFLHFVWKTMLRDFPQIARYLRSARLAVWSGRLEELRGSLIGWFLINFVVGITIILWLHLSRATAGRKDNEGPWQLQGRDEARLFSGDARGRRDL